MAFELPFILYDNVLEDGTLSVTSEESGFLKENMTDWLDWTYWKASSGADQSIDIDKGVGGIEVDTLAILSHNIGSAGSSLNADVTVYDDDNSGFASPVTLGTIEITDDNPFYLSLTLGSQRYNRIKITNTDDAPFAAVIFLGKKMEIPVGPEFSFDPDHQNVKSEKFSSYSGRMVSSSVQYSERNMNVAFKRIAQSFIISDLQPFVEDHYGQMKPFFFIPDPGDVFGTGKIYYLVAPDNPSLDLPIYNDDIGFRNWTLKAQGIRQSTFR